MQTKPSVNAPPRTRRVGPPNSVLAVVPISLCVCEVTNAAGTVGLELYVRMSKDGVVAYHQLPRTTLSQMISPTAVVSEARAALLEAQFKKSQSAVTLPGPKQDVKAAAPAAAPRTRKPSKKTEAQLAQQASAAK